MDRPIQILIVDDEQSIRWVLEQTLSELGHSLHLADSAEGAARILKDTPMDIAFIDINLPGQDGLAFMEETLKKQPNLVGLPYVLRSPDSIRTWVPTSSRKMPT